MGARIEQISVALPRKLLTNEELARDFPTWSAEKIEQKLGIKSRHVLSDDECASDIAIEAARSLFERSPQARDEVDYLIFCTQSPDYMLPTTACIIQSRLGLPSRIGAIDINQGCSGYLHGLALAKSLVEANVAGKVLLLTADAYSKLVNENDPSVRTIFGDGATATLIASCPSDESRLDHFEFGTDGSGSDKLIVRGSGMRADSDAPPGRQDLFMDGPAVLSFTLREVPPLVERLLRRSGRSMEELDFVIFHQANSFILSQLQRKMKIPSDKMVIDFADVGNTVSSTIPIALARQISKGDIQRGQTGLLVGFGVGLSWAGCVLTY